MLKSTSKICQVSSVGYLVLIGIGPRNSRRYQIQIRPPFLRQKKALSAAIKMDFEGEISKFYIIWKIFDKFIIIKAKFIDKYLFTENFLKPKKFDLYRGNFQFSQEKFSKFDFFY